jgi:hypothetical protein
MFQKDYILRIIEQLGSVLAKVIINKNAGNYKEAEMNIENAFKNILGFDSRLLSSISNKNINDLLGINKDKSIGSMKCLVAARLLKELADIQEISDKGNQNIISEYQTALNLYLEGLLNLNTCEIKFNEYNSEITEIVAKLGNVIKEETKHKLTKYYELLKTKNS